MVATRPGPLKQKINAPPTLVSAGWCFYDRHHERVCMTEKKTLIEQAEALWAKWYGNGEEAEWTWQARIQDILERNVIDAEHIRVLLTAAVETANADPDTKEHWMVDEDYASDCMDALASAEWKAFTDKHPSLMFDLFLLASLADKAVIAGQCAGAAGE
ncbi:MAG TPA: hypothetical protein VNH11_07280 [Pirellulales bacterium]|nr:hypothetical protein [Pirellulales bacterium]